MVFCFLTNDIHLFSFNFYFMLTEIFLSIRVNEVVVVVVVVLC